MTAAHACLLDDYLAWEEVRGCRIRGVQGESSRVRRFITWLEDGGLDIEDIDRRVARSYQNQIMESTNALGEVLRPRTVISYRQSASRFAVWLVETGKIPTNPFLKLRGPRQPKTVLRDVLKEADMQRFLDTLGHWESVGPDPRLQYRRYIAHIIAELQYASGLRIAEVADLEVDDIDLARRIITVREGKKGRSRMAYLSDYTAELLAIYLEEMRPLVLTAKHVHNPRLVFGCGYSALGHSQNDHLAHVGDATGLHITTHGFRHAVGYHLLRNGCPLRHIQEVLGHARIKDTEVYTKVDVPEVQEVVDEYHPRGIRSLHHAS